MEIRLSAEDFSGKSNSQGGVGGFGARLGQIWGAGCQGGGLRTNYTFVSALYCVTGKHTDRQAGEDNLYRCGLLVKSVKPSHLGWNRLMLGDTESTGRTMYNVSTVDRCPLPD